MVSFSYYLIGALVLGIVYGMWINSKPTNIDTLKPIVKIMKQDPRYQEKVNTFNLYALK